MNYQGSTSRFRSFLISLILATLVSNLSYNPSVHHVSVGAVARAEIYCPLATGSLLNGVTWDSTTAVSWKVIQGILGCVKETGIGSAAVVMGWGKDVKDAYQDCKASITGCASDAYNGVADYAVAGYQKAKSVGSAIAGATVAVGQCMNDAYTCGSQGLGAAEEAGQAMNKLGNVIGHLYDAALKTVSGGAGAAALSVCHFIGTMLPYIAVGLLTTAGIGALVALLTRLAAYIPMIMTLIRVGKAAAEVFEWIMHLPTKIVGKVLEEALPKILKLISEGKGDAVRQICLACQHVQ